MIKQNSTILMTSFFTSSASSYLMIHIILKLSIFMNFLSKIFENWKLYLFGISKPPSLTAPLYSIQFVLVLLSQKPLNSKASPKNS